MEALHTSKYGTARKSRDWLTAVCLSCPRIHCTDALETVEQKNASAKPGLQTARKKNGQYSKVCNSSVCRHRNKHFVYQMFSSLPEVRQVFCTWTGRLYICIYTVHDVKNKNFCFWVPFLKQLLFRNYAVDFVEICNVYIGKMIVKAAKRIFNSDKICRSYSDLNFGVTFLEHSVVLVDRSSGPSARVRRTKACPR